jgi:colicin import membrane protein
MTLDGNVIVTPWAPSADELAESTSASLVPAGHLQNAVEIFTKGGMKAILDGVEAKVRAMKLDVSTATGRAEIRSVAHQIARTKTALDGEGKKLTEGWRKATALVNAERNACQERLDALKEEIRKPLTEFEQRETKRVAGHEQALKELAAPAATSVGQHTSLQLTILLDENGTMHSDRNWEEFEGRATTTRAEVRKVLTQQLEARTRWEAEQAELARLRKEQEERAQRERDERIAAEAAEKARVAAERAAAEAAAAERHRVEQEAAKAAKQAADRLAAAERERKAAEDKAAAELRAAEGRAEAERELARLERERAEKEAVAKVAEAERARQLAEEKAAKERAAAVAREAKAAQDLKDAQAKAKRDAEAAVQRERNRIEAARLAEEAERKVRESNEARRKAVRAEIAAAIGEVSGGSWDGETIASAIMDGKIPHVKVVF